MNDPLSRTALEQKLKTGGPAALSDLETLTYALYCGGLRHEVPAVAKRLLSQFGSLPVILRCAPALLAQTPGMTADSASFLAFFYQLMARCARDPSVTGKPPSVLRTTADTARLFAPYFMHQNLEHLMAAMLDAKGRLLWIGEISEGSANATALNARKICRTALQYGAAGVVISHNHPHTTAQPSTEDWESTYRLANLLELLHIVLIDHVVIGGAGDFCSAYLTKYDTFGKP